MSKTMKVIRGTSNLFRIALRDESGSFYRLKAGEVLRFGVKNRRDSDDIQFVKEMTAADLNADADAYILVIKPEDTQHMGLRGRYYYDVGLQSGNDYYNVIPCSDFELGANVTGREGV